MAQNPAESEAFYLKQQADDAKAAMKATVHEMTEKLEQVVDVRVWTKRYPWISTGLAAGAGFAAGAVFTPRDRKDARHKWESIKSMFDHPDDAKGEKKRPARTKGWTSTLMRQVMRMLRPALSAAVAAAMRGGKDPHAHNGHGPRGHGIPDGAPKPI